jgi:UDP-N-acetylmuramate dehydrogenase
MGGAVRMNAGCYGRYTADIFVSARAVTRGGERVTLTAADMAFAYRSTSLPDGLVVTEVTLAGPRGEPVALVRQMEEQLARRDASQPVKDRSAGSTFRNPAGFSSTGRADDVHELKAWKLIEDAGMKGASLGGARMSEKHANFLINAGGAKAADLEALGELVRKRVLDSSGVTLEWEIMRVGRP